MYTWKISKQSFIEIRQKGLKSSSHSVDRLRTSWLVILFTITRSLPPMEWQPLAIFMAGRTMLVFIKWDLSVYVYHTKSYLEIHLFRIIPTLQINEIKHAKMCASTCKLNDPPPTTKMRTKDLDKQPLIFLKIWNVIFKFKHQFNFLFTKMNFISFLPYGVAILQPKSHNLHHKDW